MKDCVLITLPSGNPLFVIQIENREQVTDLFLIEKVEKWYSKLYDNILVENVSIGQGFTGIQVTTRTRKTLISWSFIRVVD